MVRKKRYANQFVDSTAKQTQAKQTQCSITAPGVPKKIGDYAAVKEIDKYDRVYCSEACSMKAFGHPSRDYEARGGDY